MHSAQGNSGSIMERTFYSSSILIDNAQHSQFKRIHKQQKYYNPVRLHRMRTSKAQTLAHNLGRNEGKVAICLEEHTDKYK